MSLSLRRTRNDQGGAIYGFLAAIGVMVVLLAIFFSACFSNAGAQHSLGKIQLISHHRHHDRDRDGDQYGDGDNSNGNTGYDGEGGKSGDTDQRGDHNCRNFCFYGIPQPGGGQKLAGFFPPNPGKIPQQISDFVKVVFDFVQAVTKFAI
jgi:hypothetical protein